MDIISKHHKLPLLEAVFDQSLSSIVITDADMENGGPHIVLCNEAFSRMTGYATEELIGQNPNILQGPETDRDLIARLKQCLMSGEFFHGRTINYTKDRLPYVVEWNISAVYDDTGKICNYVSVQSNLSAQVKAEKERDILAHALNESRDCVMVLDELGKITFINKGFQLLTGFSAHEVLGKSPEFILPEDDYLQGLNIDKTMASQSLVPHDKSYVAIRKKDGSKSYLIKDQSIVKSEDGLSECSVCIGKDVTEQIHQRKNLEFLAKVDRLTGLLNRHAGDGLLNQAIQDSLISQAPVSVILGDIDFFKKVNDLYGHLAGDRILSDVSVVLKRAVRAGDYCIRWGGEEFLILLPGCSIAVAESLAERIRSQVSEQLDAQVGQVTMSFGVAQWDADESVNELIARVDRALYEAKNSGRNRVVISAC